MKKKTKAAAKSRHTRVIPGVYGTKELARFFGVTEKTVCEWCKEGKLPTFKIGHEWKIRVEDLRKTIDNKVRAREKGAQSSALF